MKNKFNIYKVLVICFLFYILSSCFQKIHANEPELKNLNKTNGNYLLLQIDIANLLYELAEIKANIYSILNTTKVTSRKNNSYFLNVFKDIIDQEDIHLKYYYPDLGSENSEILGSLSKKVEKTVNSIMEVLKNRLDKFGISKYTIQRKGKDKIVLKTKGAEGITPNIKRLIQNNGKLKFEFVKDSKVTRSAIKSIDRYIKEGNNKNIFFNNETNYNKQKPFSSLLQSGRKGKILVKKRNIYIVNKISSDINILRLLPYESKFYWLNKLNEVTTRRGSINMFCQLFLLTNRSTFYNRYLKDTDLLEFSNKSKYVIKISFNDLGKREVGRMTKANTGKKLAIVINDKIYNIMNIKNRIRNRVFYIGNFDTVEEARIIDIILNTGVLSAPVDIIKEKNL